MARPTPFTIIIDSAEQLPFPFTNLYTDAEHENEPWQVKTVRGCLGRYPDSWGDYSIIGFEKRVAVERKSVSDLQTTILGFNDGHRSRFEGELANLNQCEAAAVVVEGSFLDVIAHPPEWGKRTKEQNAKTLARSILAYQADYNQVQWIFASDRDMAQYCAFHWLRRFWQCDFDARKKATREKERAERAEREQQKRLFTAKQMLQSRLFRDVNPRVSQEKV